MLLRMLCRRLCSRSRIETGIETVGRSQMSRPSNLCEMPVWHRNCRCGPFFSMAGSCEFLRAANVEDHSAIGPCMSQNSLDRGRAQCTHPGTPSLDTCRIGGQRQMFVLQCLRERLLRMTLGARTVSAELYPLVLSLRRACWGCYRLGLVPYRACCSSPVFASCRRPETRCTVWPSTLHTKKHGREAEEGLPVCS